MDHEECKRRLKCWFILGNDPATPTLESNPWEPGRHRSSHVHKFGGYRLRELASDNKDCLTHGASDEMLDYMCADVDKQEWQAQAEDTRTCG